MVRSVGAVDEKIREQRTSVAEMRTPRRCGVDLWIKRGRIDLDGLVVRGEKIRKQ